MMTPSLSQASLFNLIDQLPKAELHVHIEGTLEPELLFELAKRNQITLPYADIDALRAAYDFQHLQSFLDLYYAGAAVLCSEQDFFDLTWAYLSRAHADHVVHAEIFFDPQTHTARGIPFETVYNGISRALKQAQYQWGLTSKLILCFLRHLPEQDGFEALQQAMPYLAGLDGVGLDSSEAGHPPHKFIRLFEHCRSLGLPVVAHAGEEGPPDYVTEALDLLHCQRIDHGVRSLEDPLLVQRLIAQAVPLTVCPLSNIRLKVFNTMSDHPLKTMLNLGLKVTINSDDPAYFGGYINDNFKACVAALPLTMHDIITLARNSIYASWLPDNIKKIHLQRIQDLEKSYRLTA